MNKKTHFFATLIMIAATAAVLVYADIFHCEAFPAKNYC